jgi:hypothetical protein
MDLKRFWCKYEKSCRSTFSFTWKFFVNESEKNHEYVRIAMTQSIDQIEETSKRIKNFINTRKYFCKVHANKYLKYLLEET